MSVDNPGDTGRTVTGYTKLFGSIVHSTIWREPAHVRLVWVTMLALADKNGVVEASIPGLADVARVSLDDCLDALARFQKPDLFSRNKASGGRRIEELQGGWRLLNHGHYRALMSRDEQKEKDRLRKQEERAAAKLSKACPDLSENVPEVRHSEAAPSPDPDPKAEGSGTLPAVWFTLEGWEPTEALRGEAIVAGVSPEDFDRRLADLRTGPIGGKRGVLDRDAYVRAQFPKWATWGASERLEASRALTGGRRPTATGPTWEPNAKHKAFCAAKRLPFAELVARYKRSGGADKRSVEDTHKDFGARLMKVARGEADVFLGGVK